MIARFCQLGDMRCACCWISLRKWEHIDLSPVRATAMDLPVPCYYLFDRVGVSGFARDCACRAFCLVPCDGLATCTPVRCIDLGILSCHF